MASRRTKRNAAKEIESSDDGVQSSQPSTNSTDEQELKELIKFKAKRSRQQQAMLNDYKNEVESAIEENRVAALKAFLAGVDVIVKMADDFITEQVNLQATISDLWEQVRNSQIEFSNYTREYHAATLELEEVRAERHLDSLSLQKRACEDHLASIDGLKNTV